MSDSTPAPAGNGEISTTMEWQPVSPIEQQSPRASHDGSSVSTAQQRRTSSSSVDSVEVDHSMSNGNAPVPATRAPAVQLPQSLPSTKPQDFAASRPVSPGFWKSFWAVAMLWKGELIAALIAHLLVAIEVVLFAHYDNKFMFSNHFGLDYTATWPFSFKINALFAFLTSLIEATVSFYLASCIGQLRWHFYMQKAHRMGWLDIMTDARGPPGALRLILKRGMHRWVV
jgi:hypothetical protein